jgi:serine/threonine protein kinase
MSDQGNNPGGELDGQTLGQYQIEHQVGQGGMATVYLGKQTSIGRTVAIKVMPMYFMHDPNFLQRFEREVQVIAKLQHPRILPVYDYGQNNNRPFIVMAYMPGGTIADLIEKGPVPIPEVVRLTEQIAEGLDFAHREGIIHRDFKPSNVLLDRGGNVHLADFGIAKVTESTSALTGSGVVGTPAYMAPEMASEGIVTPSVDIYALGVTLYQMLTGRYPFSGDTPLRVMMAHATEPVPDVRTVRADLPQAVADVVRKAMAKDPMDRYATATELAADLRAAVSAKGTAERPTVQGPAAERTVVESAPNFTPPPAYAPQAPVQTPSPAYTPAPPPSAYTPPPPAAVGSGGYAVQPAKKGISPLVIIGGLFGLGLLACLALGGAGLVAAMLAPTATPTPTPTPTSTPTPTPTNTPVATAVPEALMNFSNETGTDICWLYVSGNALDNGWGGDLLGSDEVLTVSETADLDVPPGTYDFLAEDCDQNVIDWIFGYTIQDDDTGVRMLGYDSELIIENNSGEQMCEVYIWEQGWDDWSPNLIISGHEMDNNTSRSFALPTATYSMLARTCSALEAQRDDQEIDGTFTWTLNPPD